MSATQDTDPYCLRLEPGHRVLLNTTLLGLLGWANHEGDFTCHGFFQGPTQLVCAPDWLRTDEDKHPFADLLAAVEALKKQRPPDLRHMPKLESIALQKRTLVDFEAKWVTDERRQLNLYVGRPTVLLLAGIIRGKSFRQAEAYGFPAYGTLTLVEKSLGEKALQADLNSAFPW